MPGIATRRSWKLATCCGLWTLLSYSTLSLVAGEPESVELRVLGRHALVTAGDIGRGRDLFFNERGLRCAVCHRIDGRGGDAGPDLSAIGGKFGRPHLIESLLEPSRQIVEGFRASVVLLKSGHVISGIVKSDSGAVVALVDSEGRHQRIPSSDIELRRESDVSLMPTGLAQALSPEQFTDLVAFLESCRTGSKGTPGSHVAGGLSLPAGFQAEIVATGLTGATALETTADMRTLICEQTGALRVVRDGQLQEQPVLTLEVDDHWERGLFGVTVDPGFPQQPFIYVCYVARQPYPHHRVSRFVWKGDVVDAGSELVLLEGDDQRELGGKVQAGHQGGALHFAPDGQLYVAIGDQTAGSPAQKLNTFQGKLLRIGRDGSIPQDNPFVNQTEGKYRAIWALGLRNPFTFAINGRTGEMYINDVGGDRFEEINRGVAGGNYGWPIAEGPTDDDRFQSPIYSYPRASICGGDFVPVDARWPERFRGKYLLADFIHGWIKALDPDRPEQFETFASGLRNPVDLRFAADGSLLVLLRNAWVKDDKFSSGTGSLIQISAAAERLE